MRDAIMKRDRKLTTPMIMELKPVSSDGSDLFRGRTVQSLARQYELSGAVAISVVTGSWFGGHINLLELVRTEVSLPILRKDFIVSKKGIAQSKLAGATAVLLTAKIMQKSQLSKMIEECEKQQLSPFVEVESGSDLDNVELSKNSIVAVNNKNIENREVTGPGITRSLSQIVALRQRFGVNQCIVSASGISSRNSGERLVSKGFDALLVGTSLLEAPNLKKKLAQYEGFGVMCGCALLEESL